MVMAPYPLPFSIFHFHDERIYPAGNWDKALAVQKTRTFKKYQLMLTGLQPIRKNVSNGFLRRVLDPIIVSSFGYLLQVVNVITNSTVTVSFLSGRTSSVEFHPSSPSLMIHLHIGLMEFQLPSLILYHIDHHLAPYHHGVVSSIGCPSPTLDGLSKGVYHKDLHHNANAAGASTIALHASNIQRYQNVLFSVGGTRLQLYLFVVV
ncbi:uncharacterized protein C8R40DRAFT_1075259 [Lentinula edodes]|uniref:uncharacterized protein n=1 Tax=Lentinula edodes TaxID=5353 RepID=UPI001E8E6792|nr:uncharacterized protein C8R40DRAFT_1075259 [Lentinula edodes]KAH7867903.1 hypothetical protein C8R40DRAFT_1075259 [Lentinula edodes]